MQNKRIVITGATSGLGEVAARRLAEQGAKITLVARSKARAEATLSKLAGSGHSVHYADLSSIAEMKRVGTELASAYPQIDVLMNNAGGIFHTRQTTIDGLEMSFAMNHLSYFVVTNLLLENLKATPGARIVSTASDAHKTARLNFADLQSAQRYSALDVYGKSKLANILFTRSLKEKLTGTGVTANCLHPGFVASRFGEHHGGALSVMFKIAKSLFAISPEKGARTMVHLAASPDVAAISGLYFAKSKISKPFKQARDDAAAQRLWSISSDLTGVGNI